MRYIFLYFYRWLKVILLNLYRGCFWLKNKEIQRYVSGDLVAINYHGDKCFVEVLDAVYYCSTPYYKLKSVMVKGFDSSRYVHLAPPNRRATPKEMRKYALFLSKLKFARGDWFYDVFMRTIYRVLKIELHESSGNPYYTIASFPGKEWSTFNLSLNDIKLPKPPKFKYKQTVCIESINKQGVVVGANITQSDDIIYDVLIDRKIRSYLECELLESQKSCKMEKSTVETKVFEPLFKAEEKTKVESQEPKPLFKVGDKVKIVPPKNRLRYRTGYTDNMQKIEGTIAVITKYKQSGQCSIPNTYDDDGYIYVIDTNGCLWTSQSFEKVESSVIEDPKSQQLFKVGDRVKIIPPKNKSTYRGGYTTNMGALEGRIVTITNCTLSIDGPNNDDGYIYKISEGGEFYSWSSQSFAKVEPQPLFKIGDIVKILPPKSLTGYKHGYNDSMKALEGKTATITSIRLDDLCGSYNDDGYVYTIDIDCRLYKWSSQSFRKVESAPLFKVGDKVKIVPPKDTKEYRYGYDENKKKLEFQVAVITERNKYNGCFSYPDDGYEYKIDIDSFYSKWSSQSFMKLEELQQAVLSSSKCDITSVQVDGTLLTTYPIQCGELSILDRISDDWSAKKEEKEEKKEKYKLNFKIK